MPVAESAPTVQPVQQPLATAPTLQTTFQPQPVAGSATALQLPSLPGQIGQPATLIATGQPAPPPGSQLVSQIQQPLPFQVSMLICPETLCVLLESYMQSIYPVFSRVRASSLTWLAFYVKSSTITNFLIMQFKTI